MANDRVVLCGSATIGNLPDSNRPPLRLIRWGAGANVDLKIEDMRHGMVQDVPSICLDLLDIATFVCVADQATPRGNGGDEDMGERWRRRFFFRIPVNNVDFWSAAEVRGELERTLGFLSEDEFDFAFEPLLEKRTVQQYFKFGESVCEDADEVMMFSGGLDSLGGAVQEAIIESRKVLLVHHRSTPKLARRHASLLDQLKQRTTHRLPIHVPVRVNKQKALSREPTQRTRSFLYASLGAAIALMIGRSRLRFYENGVLSLNLPPSAQVVGARATRTTHPQVLNGFSRLFSKVAGRPFVVENPFLWKTKTDVLKLIAERGCAPLIRHSTSCADTRRSTNAQTHCGVCSQCVDRRFSVLAAGLGEHDPATNYGVDLLLGNRVKGNPRTMLAAYVETANEIERMTPQQFFAKFGELSRILRHIELPPSIAAMRIFELYKRHAEQVVGVVDRAIADHADRIRRRELPPSCLIRLVADSMAVSNAQEPEEEQKPKSSDNEANYFRAVGDGWEVRFAAGKAFVLQRQKGAAYLHELLAHPGATIPATELANRLAPPTIRRGDVDIASDGEISLTSHGARIPGTPIDERSDDDTLSAVEERLREIPAELERATRDNDLATQRNLEQEREELLAYLRNDIGFQGRVRGFNSANENHRKAVCNAISRVLERIKKHDARLFAHLAPPSLRLGKQLCYEPDSTIHWET